MQRTHEQVVKVMVCHPCNLRYILVVGDIEFCDSCGHKLISGGHTSIESLGEG